MRQVRKSWLSPFYQTEACVAFKPSLIVMTLSPEFRGGPFRQIRLCFAGVGTYRYGSVSVAIVVLIPRKLRGG